ncbi:ROK family protein [Azospirillum sp.]|uniref:ROK family protein n=1 Tax=Azospirillum sp. TaxID=34012 RepID=UPI003D71939E
MRIGIDLGGTKIAAVALDDQGVERARTRADTPRAYDATLTALADAVAALERAAGPARGVGISLPGVVDPAAGTVRAVNLPWLDGRPFAADLAARCGRGVRIANDGNCFALSEAVDGAAAGCDVVFGAILGTGVGGGLVAGGRILAGANALAGEWGHTPLPWRNEAEDGPAEPCGCGRPGCVETLLCGAGLARLHLRHSGEALDPPEIARRAEAGDAAARATLDRHADALARALAVVVHILDPDAVVIGGGLSQLPGLAEAASVRLGRHTLAPVPRTRIVRARHGAESGMRGGAWLWPKDNR